MVKYYDSLLHLDGNVMAAIDVETTGNQPGHHEVVQIGIQVLDGMLQPHADVSRPVFYLDIKPDYPERFDSMAMSVNGLDTDYLLNHATERGLASDLLLEWFEQLELPFGKVLVPLAHNWSCEDSWLKDWLGVPATRAIFHSHARDSMALALHMNDKAAFNGEDVPFKYLSLSHICKVLGVKHDKQHDALGDARVTAEVYAKMLLMEF